MGISGRLHDDRAISPNETFMGRVIEELRNRLVQANASCTFQQIKRVVALHRKQFPGAHKLIHVSVEPPLFQFLG